MYIAHILSNTDRHTHTHTTGFHFFGGRGGRHVPLLICAGEFLISATRLLANCLQIKTQLSTTISDFLFTKLFEKSPIYFPIIKNENVNLLKHKTAHVLGVFRINGHLVISWHTHKFLGNLTGKPHKILDIWMLTNRRASLQSFNIAVLQ
jgi:hypothetical protein